MNKTAKRLLIAGIVLVILAVIGTVAVYVGVNMAFSKVTQTIGESDLLKNGNGLVELPVISEGEQEGESIQAEMDAETMKKLEAEISMADKLAVLKILASALPHEEYSRLLKMVTDGVTQEEITQAYQVLRANLTQEQKNQIKQYYAKYLYLLAEPILQP